MNDGKISVRYSRALFESALDKKLLDKVYDDMIFLSGICDLPEMKEFLNSPIIVPSKKIEIFRNITADNIQELTMSFIELVVINERESFLPAMTRVFRQETKKYRGITESVLITAVSVDEKIKKQVSDLIAGLFKTKVDLTGTIDKEIIGGFILRIEDNYIDASVRTKLRRIEKELKGRTLMA